MYKSIRIAGICAVALSLAGTAIAGGPAAPPPPIVAAPPGDPGTLFPASQFTIDIYGESANGDIDFTGGTTKLPTTTTTTTTTTVLAPTTPTPPTGVITVADKPSFKSAAVIRPLAIKVITSTTSTTTTKGDIATTTTTTKTTKIVQTSHTDHNAGGGGVQLAYFFTRYVGLAVEGDFLGGDPFISQATGQLILRYPIDLGRKPVSSGYSKDAKDVRDYKGSEMGPPTWGVAPYFICGGGGQWDGEGVGIADVGGGVEVRCAAGWDVFTDARWVVRNTQQNYADVRLGLGYSF
jgi:hypothetical protein